MVLEHLDIFVGEKVSSHPPHTILKRQSLQSKK